jgi:hypothetical protein
MRVNVGWFRKELFGLRKPKYGPGGPFTASVPVKKGKFRKKIRIPRGLFPGKYAFMGYGQAGSTIISIRQRYVTLGAPPEGVVGKAYASATNSGPPTKRLPATARAIYFKYFFAKFPKTTKLTVVPTVPPGEPRGFCSYVLSSFIPSGFAVKLAASKGKNCVPTNARLHRGVWSVLLVWHKRPIARASVRVG